ncbi:hypothetical protein Q7A53_03860 [Halobacillus rhizosphaerae]|uniref:hypothetical protein n=1 Tax=Halobacillus rhizosphaerae TaxID=3064889 RepID=UPI00398B6E1E
MKLKLIAFSIIAILILSLGFRVVPILVKGGGNLHQELHWMVYGYDRVWYHNRAYSGPSKEMTLEQVKNVFEQEQIMPTGEKVIGLNVYDTPSSIKAQKQEKTATVLILKKHNGSFIEYSLIGGP